MSKEMKFMLMRTEIILMILQLPIDFLMLLLAGITAYYLRFADFVVATRPVVFKLTTMHFVNIASLVAVGWIFIFAIVVFRIPEFRTVKQFVHYFFNVSISMGEFCR